MTTKLTNAKLCLDCDIIYDEDLSAECPKCCSASSIRLIEILHKAPKL